LANPHLLLKDAEKIVTAFLDSIVLAMARGHRVEIRGFGVFTVRQRKARTGRNPRTGVVVSVEEKVVPHFRAGKELSERLNREPAQGSPR
jgi:integration host factor subunit beta